jgi:hypothetical protein
LELNAALLRGGCLLDGDHLTFHLGLIVVVVMLSFLH